MGFCGGLIGAWVKTRDPFWMMSGGLAGIISAAAGLDVWYPPIAFLLGFVGGIIVPISGKLIEKLGIDDAVGAVAVHGVAGFWGVLAVGLFASGYPNINDMAPVSLIGQFAGAMIFLALGFVPGYVLAFLLNLLGLLRVPPSSEIAGLDKTKVPLKAYPEGLKALPAE
jgi:ammonia channel protein AmtB